MLLAHQYISMLIISQIPAIFVLSDLRKCLSRWWSDAPSWNVRSACTSSCVTSRTRRCGLARSCRRRNPRRTAPHCWAFRCCRRRTGRCRMRWTVTSRASSASSTLDFRWSRRATHSRRSFRSLLMSSTLSGPNFWQLCRLAKIALSSRSSPSRFVVFWVLSNILCQLDSWILYPGISI